MSEGVIDKPAHRIYHGIADDRDGNNARIVVMDRGDGPMQRQQATELYQLAPAEPVWWGYSGNSPGRAAVAILDDILPDAVPAELLADWPRELRSELARGLMDDFLAYFHDGKQFWLAAPTVVRWIHGYLELPPASPGG